MEQEQQKTPEPPQTGEKPPGDPTQEEMRRAAKEAGDNDEKRS